jgi:hypothetical protein
MDLKKRPSRWSRKCRLITAAVVLVVILAVVIPLAVLLPKKHMFNTSVLLSLYIYPQNDSSWAPLYQA